MTTSEEYSYHYRLMFSENGAVMLLIDPKNGKIIDASQGACQYYGYSLSDLTSMSIFDINTMSRDKIIAEMQRAKEQAKNYCNAQHRLASGEIRDVEVYANLIPVEDQKFLYSIIHDITERRLTEAALQESNNKFRALVETTQDFIWEVNSDGVYTYCSPQIMDILGYKPEELLGKTPFDFMPAEEVERMGEIFKDALAQQIPINVLDNINVTKDGCKVVLETSALPFFSASGGLQGYRGIDRDITKRKQAEEAHKKLEAELKHLATHDSLTGLYNRKMLEEQIAEEIHRAKRYGHSLSVFMLDLDHFKQVNDTYGHATGDTVLQSFSNILVQSIRNSDYAARYGGEEFVIILPETSLNNARELAERLCSTIAEHLIPINDDDMLKVTTSLGVATYPEHGRSWNELLTAADNALYQAKEAGRNQVVTA